MRWKFAVWVEANTRGILLKTLAIKHAIRVACGETPCHLGGSSSRRIFFSECLCLRSRPYDLSKRPKPVAPRHSIVPHKTKSSSFAKNLSQYAQKIWCCTYNLSASMGRFLGTCVSARWVQSIASPLQEQAHGHRVSSPIWWRWGVKTPPMTWVLPMITSLLQ